MGLDSPAHWAVLIVIVLLLFGYKKLPDASRSLGRSLRIFKTEIKGMSEDDKARDQASPASTPESGLVPPAQPATAPAAPAATTSAAATVPAATATPAGAAAVVPSAPLPVEQPDPARPAAATPRAETV